MNQLRSISSNLSSVSIWKASARNMVSNANEDEKVRHPVIAIEALRTISHIVRPIKERIDDHDRNRPANDTQAGSAADRSGSTTTSPNCGESSN
jgi:hypothetical protein